MMGEVPLTVWPRRGEEARRRREILVRTVSRWRCRFPWGLDFQDWTRQSSPPGAGTSLAAVAVATQRKKTEAGSTQGRCRATRTQSPRPLPCGERSGRGAHTWTRLRLPRLPTPCSRHRRSPAQRRGDGPTLARRFLVLAPGGKANPTSFPSDCLLFWDLFVFEPAVAGPRAALGSCKQRGCGPCRSTLGSSLARREAAPRHGWAPGKMGGHLGGEGGCAPCASPKARPRGAGVLPLKWFHPSPLGLNSRTAKAPIFFPLFSFFFFFLLRAETRKRRRRKLGRGAGRRRGGGSAPRDLGWPGGAGPRRFPAAPR